MGKVIVALLVVGAVIVALWAWSTSRDPADETLAHEAGSTASGDPAHTVRLAPALAQTAKTPAQRSLVSSPSRTPVGVNRTYPADTANSDPSRIKHTTRSYKQVLKKQIASINEQLIECAHSLGGPKLNGHAALTFIVGPQPDQDTMTIETTGINHEETTLTDETLLACLRDTAHAMTFDSLPDGVDAVSVYRAVIFKNGELIDHRLTEFANLRDDE